MPYYEYECPAHGVFTFRETMTASTMSVCPNCGRLSHRIPSRTNMIMRKPSNLPLGNGVAGKFISHTETGGSDIFIPSWGSMEQGEVDDVALAAIEKDKTEQKHPKRERATKNKIQDYMNLAHKTKPGQRAKTIREAMKDTA
jgi:putative FmdB family regulatory protein